MDAFWIAVFALAGALVFLAYPGYPILLWLLRRSSPQPPVGDGPPVDVVLVVRNEASRIAARLHNLMESAHPIREIIVVCDGCTDDTAAVARATGITSLRIIEIPTASGKPSGLNAGVAVSQADVVVFCDARQKFDARAIPTLARWFLDESTGAVSGSLGVEASLSSTGRGVDAYWKLEKLIRKFESDSDSSVGCTGAVYAIRRSLFRPIPADTILDDVVIPMTVARAGYRVRFDEAAMAFDPQTLDGEREQKRKIRTLAGNFQMMFRYPTWMLPGGHRLWWKLILHKYLRLAGPALFVSAFVASVMVSHLPVFWWLVVAQAAIACLAAIGLVIPGLLGPAVAIPAGFLFLQWCIVRAFFYWLRPRSAGWR